MLVSRFLRYALITLTFFCSLVWASPQEIALLDNRFRVDPTIKQASFVIYRSEGSQPVVLVRPDGTKYYAWQHPEHVAWYEEDGMDIISVESPMPGPWQAIGEVTPKNNIKIVSDLKLSVDTLSTRLYQHERIKFKANLTQGGEPITLRDFLNRVRLSVTFTPFLENEQSVAPEARPQPITVGSFLDGGEGYDEVAGDGMFTVDLPISVEPGKYRVRVTSGNGVFLRAVEQTVLVYPSPLIVDFVQSREGGDHRLSFIGEESTIAAGSMSVHATTRTPKKVETHFTRTAKAESNLIELAIPNSPDFGTHTIESVVYATDKANQREIVLDGKKLSFGVSPTIDLVAAQERQRIEQQRIERETMIREMEMTRAKERQRAWLVIGVGNIVVLVLGVLLALFIRKRRQAAAEEPEMQLTAPPS